MLSNLATELIEEILLYLPYREFLRAIRLNSRLWSIAHHPKSPLRHRLRGRTSRICFELGYYEMSDNSHIDLSISIDETIPGSTNKRRIKRELDYVFPKVALTDELYVESEEDRRAILMEKSRAQMTYKIDNDLDGTNDSEKSYNYNKISPDLSMRLVICNIYYITCYLTINKEFILKTYNGILLNKFLLHFNAYDIRLAQISFEAWSGSINLPRLYESKFFQQKLYALYFFPLCEAIGNNLDFHHYEIHRNKLREVKRFTKNSKYIPIKHTDDDLLLLDNIEYLQLFGEDEITGNRIAKLVKKIYEHKQGRKFYIDIKITTKQKFTIEEVLKCVPESKITKDVENGTYFTNMFNEVFIVECYEERNYHVFRLHSPYL